MTEHLFIFWDHKKWLSPYIFNTQIEEDPVDNDSGVGDSGGEDENGLGSDVNVLYY